MENLENQDIFIVTDCGTSSPTQGLIFGAFTNKADADELVKTITSAPKTWGLYPEESVEVYKIQLNKQYNWSAM